MTDPTAADSVDEAANLPALRQEAAEHALLQRAPVIDRLNKRQLELLQKLSPNVSPAELAQGLELAVAYQLDPYAREIWFLKSRGRNGGEGKLLIMVGKPGLRKIAQRNQLEVLSDVVCERDEFEENCNAAQAAAKTAARQFKETDEKYVDLSIVNECLTSDLTKARERLAEYGGRRTVAEVIEEHDVHHVVKRLGHHVNVFAVEGAMIS